MEVKDRKTKAKSKSKKDVVLCLNYIIVTFLGSMPF